jgi:hypothetical protein
MRHSNILHTRRTLAAGLAAALASALLPGPATAQPVAAFRAVRVDASAIAALGRPGFARTVEALVQPRANEVFADRLAPGQRGAPVLVLRIDSISMPGYAGLSRRRGPGHFDEQNDTLEGEGLVVAANGAVLQRVPILSALSPGYSGAYYLDDIDARRVSNIGWHFASWVKRRL